jgi:hypothetical protein
MTIEQERLNVLKEMTSWLDHDPTYVYTLNVYALQQGWITEDESIRIKQTLDDHYKDYNNSKQLQNKYMMEVFKKIGFSKTKVLWRLIDQFPKYIVDNPEDCTFKPHNEHIIKQTGIPSVDYYTIINELVELGYIEKISNKKLGQLYKINFMKIKEEGEYAI